MIKRITVVACFDDLSNDKIKNVIEKCGYSNLCKVPLYTEDRIKNDTFPFHISLSAWKIEQSEEVLEKFKNFEFKKFTCDYEFDVMNFMDSVYTGKVLYLDPITKNEILNLQEKVFNTFPTGVEKFFPQKFKPHCSICIDEDKEKVNNIYQTLKNEKLNLVIDRICVYDFYPANLLLTIKEKNYE